MDILRNICLVFSHSLEDMDILRNIGLVFSHLIRGTWIS
uniref:Uncharacterized protein n=1 Tax=Anguilla anguilla TaxID=7936 RepID=A0A0E9S9I9_ANGAN